MSDSYPALFYGPERRGLIKQDRQCTYNVTLRRFRDTIVVVEKQQVLHAMAECVALAIQHARHMCYIVICGLPHSTIFFHIIS